jgi:hypothetical protein
LAPPAEALFGVVFPPFTSGDLTVPNDSFVTGSPNRYGNVIVRARSTLTIPAGSYYFDSLLVEPQATLVADDSLGPVFVYVRSALTLRGTVRGLESTVPELLLADFGSGSIELSGPFQGTLIARDALLNFSSQQVHSGAFYANHVTVGPDTKLTLAPFLKTRFTDAGGTPIGQCSNRASNAGTHRTVCLGARTDGTATLEMYVDGVLTPSTTGDCVDAVVKEPSTEVRAFELNQGGAVLHSDLVLLTTPAHADRCPLYSKMILGTRDDDILTGTSEAEYISGGPGNDLISGNGGEDVLVGGAGSDVFAFLDQIPVKIGVAWLVNDSSDKVQLDFTPGNMSGLFPRTTAPVSPSSVALAHRRFQSLGFGATASDFTAALGAPVTPNSLQALSIRPAATQAPIQVQFSSVTGSVVNGVTEYNTSSPSSGVLRYVLAVQQTVTPANTALKCGGTLGSCIFSSISIVDATGKAQGNPVVLPRAQHLIQSVSPTFEKSFYLVAGYSDSMPSDGTCAPVAGNTTCQSNSAFLARFDANKQVFDFFQYFDGAIAKSSGDGFDPGAPGSAFFDARLAPGPRIVAVGWTEADGDVEVEQGLFAKQTGLKGYAAVIEPPFAFATGGKLPAGDLTPTDARAFRGLEVGTFSRLKRLPRGKLPTTIDADGNTLLTFLAGGHAGSGHFQPWLLSLTVDADSHLHRLAERIVTNSEFFAEVEDISETQIVGETDEFDVGGRAGAGAFFADMNPADLTFALATPGGSTQQGSFFQDVPGFRLFGGAAQTAAFGILKSRHGRYIVGQIQRPWDSSLLNTLPTTPETGPFGLLIDVTSSGDLLNIKSIGSAPIQTIFSGVDSGPDDGLVTWGSVCSGSGADCTPNPYLLGVDQDFGTPSCSCSDGVANCGEEGIDCGTICGNACPPPPPPTPPTNPPPEPTCKIDPSGTEMTVYLDPKDAATFVTSNGCQSCHSSDGKSLSGTPFAPCLYNYSASAEQGAGCMATAITQGRGAMPKFNVTSLGTCGKEVLVNYLLGLTGTCASSAKSSQCAR